MSGGNETLMRTRCPECVTVFRVTSEQLRQKAGKVRCGHCQAVFNAFDHWQAEGHEENPVEQPVADIGHSAMRLLFDVTGSPIDTDHLGPDLRKAASENHVFVVGFDPLTDAQLVRHLGKRTEAISGQKWANASARFAASRARVTSSSEKAGSVATKIG